MCAGCTKLLQPDRDGSYKWAQVRWSSKCCPSDKEVSTQRLHTSFLQSTQCEVESSWFWGDEGSSITRFTTSLEADPSPSSSVENSQWFQEPLDQALRPSSCNLAHHPLRSWLILIPVLHSQKASAEQRASRQQGPPSEVAKGLFSPCLKHA